MNRFYFKQQKWELAEVEIKNAQELWDNVNKSHISCLKCNTVLEVSIKQLYGDLNLEMNTTKGFRKARSYYNDAESMLKLDMWKNKFSCPKKVSGRMFCGECGISSGSVAENDDESCWHRQASRITESNSLESVSYMKVEYLRRSILIRLFAGIDSSLLVGMGLGVTIVSAWFSP
ncbi:hypothetical protein Tco_0053603 [Tanacetum coccineum]